MPNKNKYAYPSTYLSNNKIEFDNSLPHTINQRPRTNDRQQDSIIKKTINLQKSPRQTITKTIDIYIR